MLFFDTENFIFRRTVSAAWNEIVIRLFVFLHGKLREIFFVRKTKKYIEKICDLY